MVLTALTYHPSHYRRMYPKDTSARKLTKSLIFTLDSLRALKFLSVKIFRVLGLAGLTDLIVSKRFWIENGSRITVSMH